MASQIDRVIRDKSIDHAQLVIGGEGIVSLVNCELSHCVVRIVDAESAPGVFGSILSDCVLIYSDQVKNRPLFSNDFLRCTFKGKFKGVDFGRNPWPDGKTYVVERAGDLLDCDFGQAELEMCRFFSVDVDHQKFAGWPQFVVPHRAAVEAANLKRDWPGRFSRFLKLCETEHPSLSATTGTRTDFMKKYGMSEFDLIETLGAIPGVLR